MADARLLQQRRATKLKKPRFLRQDATRNKSLEKKWRKAKGMHSKMRLHLKGRRRSPSPGFASPRAVKGLTRQGLKEVHVNNAKDLEGFDLKTQIVVFGRIGLRNKMSLLKICGEKKYPIAQIKDISAFIQKVEADFATRKNKNKHKEEQKKKIKEESLKKIKEVDKKEEKTAPAEAQEETKKGEKSDKIKVLEKKQ
ncbi:MAG: eL32 family ribosomal protein [bacterium]|nr:eL32 family ribosomal protein [bacterium]